MGLEMDEIRRQKINFFERQVNEKRKSNAVIRRIDALLLNEPTFTRASYAKSIGIKDTQSVTYLECSKHYGLIRIKERSYHGIIWEQVFCKADLLNFRAMLVFKYGEPPALLPRDEKKSIAKKAVTDVVGIDGYSHKPIDIRRIAHLASPFSLGAVL